MLFLLAVGILVVVLLTSGAEGPNPVPRPYSPLEREARQLERRLVAQPENRKLRLTTVEAWFKAGHRRLTNVNVGEEPIPTPLRDDLVDGLRIWDRYMEQTGGQAGADIAETAANTSMELAEIGSRNPAKVEEHVARAAKDVKIAGRQNPTLFTLSNVAVYLYFNGEYARGDIAATGAADDAHSKRLHRIAVEQLEAYRERAETFRRLLREANEELRDSGEELLDEPLKAYVHQAGLNKDDPTE